MRDKRFRPLTTNQKKLIRVLNSGKPLPSATKLAQACGFASTTNMGVALTKLAKHGLLRPTSEAIEKSRE